MSQHSHILNRFSVQAWWMPASLALGLLLGGPVASAESAMAVDTSHLKVSADHQSYNLEQHKIFLNGHVKVNYGLMHIFAERGEVQTDAANKPQIANFFNHPVFKRITADNREDTVVSDLLRLYLAEDRYDAKGNVTSHVATVASDPFLIRSDIQEFDQKNHVMSASGSVKVDYKGAQAFGNLANVRLKDNGKAERAIFTGNARILKENSDIRAERITVMVDSNNLIAEHHVNTWVVLKPKAETDTKTLAAAPANTGFFPGEKAGSGKQPEKVFISSDYQQYDKASETMLASGNVKVLYGDYVAVGPKAMFYLKNQDLDHILFTGRATITETDRTVTADKITITTHPRNFDAYGHVKVDFATHNSGGDGADPFGMGATHPPAKSGKAPAKLIDKRTGKPLPPEKLLPKDDSSDY